MPDLKLRLGRHRKDNRLIVGGLAALLVVLVGIFYLLQRGRDLPDELVGNQVMLFVLWYANVVLILAILFVLLRNLFKLVVERRHRILGSKFKVKLVATYVGLALIPVILLFAYATELLQGTVDRWVASPVGDVFLQANEVVEALYERLEDDALRAAGGARAAIEPLDPRDPADRPELGRRLQDLLGDLRLDYLAIYDGGDFLHGVVDPRAGIADLPEPGRAFLATVTPGEPALRVVAPPGDEGGRLVLAAVTLEEPGEGGAADAAADGAGAAGDGEETLLVVAGILLEPELARVTGSLVQAAQGHRQLVVQREAIEASHLLIFLLVTLLILLASSWVGLYLARRVTVPIQALAVGTERVGRGDLDHRVEVEADDELGALVGSFNRMTAELQRSRELAERRNRELKAANQRLAEERALIAAVVDNVAAGVIAFDREGRIVTCNGAALAMLRQSAEKVLGRPAVEAWGEGERRQLVELLDGEGRVERELHLLLEGEWKSFEVKVTPMVGAAGERRGRVMVLEDLTELIKAQQLAAWSEAARRIAHEIKNPLTPIKLAAERTLQKYRRGDDDLGEALESGVETIVREVAAMQAMVDEFSRYARMPRPRPERVDLDRLITETAQLYRGVKPGVEVAADVGSEAGAVRVDAEQIKRALINLMDNAVEATEAPGRVEVGAGVTDGHVCIRIADTGRGVPPEARDKLFLPYYSTKGRGSGLGLAIVHRIVADHHGTVRVEENRPRGTVFSIRLPV